MGGNLAKADAKEISYCIGLSIAPLLGLNDYEQIVFSEGLSKFLI
jgi:hypothetical protein